MQGDLIMWSKNFWQIFAFSQMVFDIECKYYLWLYFLSASKVSSMVKSDKEALGIADRYPLIVTQRCNDIYSSLYRIGKSNDQIGKILQTLIG